MRKFIVGFFVFWGILAIQSQYSLASNGLVTIPNEYQQQLDFADYLFKEKDYERAITEYKRIIFQYNNNKYVTEKSLLRIAESYFHEKCWGKAVFYLNNFSNEYPESLSIYDALFLKAISEKNLKQYKEALSTLQYIMTHADSKEYVEKAKYQSALIHIDMEQWEKAQKMFSEIPQESSLYFSSNIFNEGLKSIDKIPQKSPATAGILAAVLPGTGHLYVERPRDALIAFLLNGAFIWSAIELFENEKYATGGIVAFFELGWYSGNIYSAVSSAHKYNKKAKQDFIDILKDRSSLSLYRDEKNSRTFIVANFLF